MTTNKTKVETKGKTLIIERIFEAPPSLMFDVWSECKHLKHWWGPKEWPMNECEMDFREGGEWHYCLRGANEGDESWGKAIYDKIEKPRKIIYRDYFADNEGTINKEMPGSKTELEFLEYNGITKQVSTTEYESPESLKTVLDMGMIDGMNSSMERLDEYLESIQD
jgi:uncharacterized protein YndB with AHSA1/START domain